MYHIAAAKAKQAVTENDSGYLLCYYVVDSEGAGGGQAFSLAYGRDHA
jgi:hypothetical protein